MFDARAFCADFNIEIAQSGKHYRPGWVNISCPICMGHSGYHGGFNILNGYYNCHRCGAHLLPKIVSLLTGVNWNNAKIIIQKYSSDSISPREPKQKINIPSQIMLPSDTQPLTKKAKQYLINRNYDPIKLAKTWGLLSTGHTGFYKYRILAPIYQNHKLVSYQCRDITNKHPQKYLACHQEEEIRQHQHCVYGIDQASDARKCIVVEGITDVWRLGIGAVATFGIAFTKQQAQLIALNFDTVFIMFDSEPQAQEKAEELIWLLDGGFGNPIKVINLPFLLKEIDPGILPQNIANDIMKEIGL